MHTFVAFLELNSIYPHSLPLYEKASASYKFGGTRGWVNDARIRIFLFL